ncbi:hypothetical protein [Massilia sp. HP4]|uniref:hypothetical protein n=1 Tax=Massilia sp. HP4 TaxID=2562316 RepID=UPI0010C01BFD|nr:hypothetical protein [Massilia sp. HP4]
MRAFCTLLLLTSTATGCWWQSGEADVEQQAEKLGREEFTVHEWKNASELERGKMTASFLRKYKATDLSRQEVEALLGDPTGYYYSDTNPAYFVGPRTVTSVHGDGYLWVFDADKSTDRIRRVFFVPNVK